jgi:hypothetical protein
MSEAISLRRLRFTPLRDVLRGRINGRLDVRACIDAAGLPAPVAQLVSRLIKRSRLWRKEKVEVADELIAHFADGLASGVTAEELVRDFGDERTAARLIGRAKRRNRSPLLQALNWVRRAVLVVVALYAIVLVRFLVGRPTISVDYLAQLNAPIERVPVDQRAWPIYRKAILALGAADKNHNPAIFRKIEEDTGQNTFGERALLDATPADREWSELTAWLDAHADGFAVLREAAAKPHMGFVLGPGGSENDPELGWNFTHPDKTLLDRSLVTVLLPDLNHMRQLARVLEADARYAEATGDAARVAADYHAMLGIGRHQDSPFVVTRLVGIGIYSLALDRLERSLASTPALLTDQQLIELAHHISTIGGESVSSLFDLSGERMSFHDVIQRMFTDDGNRDGRITPEGARSISILTGMFSGGALGTRESPLVDTVTLMGVSSVASTVASRRDILDEFDRLLDEQERRNALPLRMAIDADAAGDLADKRLSEINASPLLTARLWPIAAMFPSLNRATVTAERLLGKRDGLLVGIALELYQRRHSGQHPSMLDALVPGMLPRVPEDRISGESLGYRIVDGKPVVYSVGVDRDDDAARPALGSDERPDVTAAAEWVMPTRRNAAPIDGDWILFDGRPEPTKPTTRPS